jgi:hypothetical protein
MTHMAPAKRGGGFLRVIIRVVSVSRATMTRGAQPRLRHHSHTFSTLYPLTRQRTGAKRNWGIKIRELEQGDTTDAAPF